VSLAARIGLIAAGYAAAFVAASLVVAIRVASTSGPAAQASSGMYAFGDAALFVAVFGLLALVPTGAALYVLRPYRRLWSVLSVVALAVALSGIAAVTLFALGRGIVEPSPLATWSAVSVLRILVAPVFAPAWLVFAILAPLRSARLAFLSATAAELVVVAYAGLVWFRPIVSDWIEIWQRH